MKEEKKMTQLKSLFTSFTNTGADLGLDEIFIIVFVCLVVLALLLGYLLGRKVSNKGDKKAKKAEKKQAKQTAKEEKLKAKDEKQLAKEQEKQAKKASKKASKQETQENEWFDADSNEDDDRPSAMPIIPERSTTTFIDIDKSETPTAAPVVTRSRNSVENNTPAQSPEDRAANVAATLKAKAEANEPEVPEEPKLSKREQKKREKEIAKAEKYAERLAKQEEPKLSKKEQKKLKKAEEEGLATTVTVEADPSAEPVTAEEMAKRLESIMGTASTAPVTLGAAEEEEVPAEEIGTIQSTQIEGRHNDNWVLEEAKRQNDEADKKEAERKEKEQLPSFAFGAGVESSADDVELSSKARKKLLEEEEKKQQEEEKKERRHITSIFAKKQDEKEIVEEEEYFDENYMGEEIPDSLAGFGFSAAPALNNDEEKKEEENK